MSGTVVESWSGGRAPGGVRARDPWTRHGGATGVRGEDAASTRAPRPDGSGPLRLTRRGRVVVTLLALAVFLLVVRVGAAVAGQPGEPEEVRVHVVAAGETLWEHASAVAAPGEDVRDVVARLAELNELSSTGLVAGQRLLLPVGG